MSDNIPVKAVPVWHYDDPVHVVYIMQIINKIDIL